MSKENQNNNNNFGTITPQNYIFDKNFIILPQNEINSLLNLNISNLKNNLNNNSKLSKFATKANSSLKLNNENEKTINNNNINYFNYNSNKNSTENNSNPPKINSLSSKLFLIEYSKSKRFEEDKKITEKMAKFSHEKNIIYEENKNSKENINNNNENNEELNEYKKLLEFQEKNLLIPLEKKNDEIYKICKMKKIKRDSVPPNKSVRKFEDIQCDYEYKFKTNKTYSTIKKKRLSHSTKKFYVSTIKYTDDKGKEEEFLLFTDQDIGIFEYWQKDLIETTNDEDVNTDDEQLNLATNFTIGEIRECFKYIEEFGSSSFVNFNKYDCKAIIKFNQEFRFNI